MTERKFAQSFFLFYSNPAFLNFFFCLNPRINAKHIAMMQAKIPITPAVSYLSVPAIKIKAQDRPIPIIEPTVASVYRNMTNFGKFIF